MSRYSVYEDPYRGGKRAAMPKAKRVAWFECLAAKWFKSLAVLMTGQPASHQIKRIDITSREMPAVLPLAPWVTSLQIEIECGDPYGDVDMSFGEDVGQVLMKAVKVGAR